MTMPNRLLQDLKRILHQQSRLLAQGLLLGLLLIPHCMLAAGGRQSGQSIGQVCTFSIALLGLVCLVKAFKDRDSESIIFLLILCLVQLLIGGFLLARPYYEMTTMGWGLLGLAILELLALGWILWKK
jgi:asparagine N-glycosylation enzyme membrane subunit Stt3